MYRMCALKLLYGPKYLKATHSRPRHLNVIFYHQLEEPYEEIPSFDWYKRAFAKLTKMTHILKNVDLIDGKVVNIKDDSTIIDDSIEHKIQMFKSLARTFLGSFSMQQTLKKRAEALSPSMGSIPKACFTRSNEREPMTLNSLTKVCDFLNVSTQQRKSVRLTICQQITQHSIWTGTLEEILNSLKFDMEFLNNQSSMKGARMSEQIVSSCIRFLSDMDISSNPDSTSWMRLTPTKKSDSPTSRKWGDLLEMLNDLMKCLRSEKRLSYHMSKLEVMKEGLYQIKDVLVDRDIGYKETRHQESLVHKKLSKTLGHSSQCLFTLLLYYFHRSVRDLEVEVRGGVYEGGAKDMFCLCIGKVLTSDDEKMVWVGVKQLDRALGLFKFVWEASAMKGVLALQGHLWCVGADDRTITYRGNVFFLHGIRL